MLLRKFTHSTKFDSIMSVFRLHIRFARLHIRHAVQYLCAQNAKHVGSIRIPIRTLFNAKRVLRIRGTRGKEAENRSFILEFAFQN